MKTPKLENKQIAGIVFKNNDQILEINIAGKRGDKPYPEIFKQEYIIGTYDNPTGKKGKGTWVADKERYDKQNEFITETYGRSIEDIENLTDEELDKLDLYVSNNPYQDKFFFKEFNEVEKLKDYGFEVDDTFTGEITSVSLNPQRGIKLIFKITDKDILDSKEERIKDAEFGVNYSYTAELNGQQFINGGKMSRAQKRFKKETGLEDITEETVKELIGKTIEGKVAEANKSLYTEVYKIK